MPEVQIRETFGIGEGTIGPISVIERGVASREEIAEFITDVRSGKYVYRVDESQAQGIIEGCVDGRNRLNGDFSAAGGPTSYVIGDALTDQRYREPGEQVVAHAKRLFGALASLGNKIRNHNDSTNAHAHGPNCGCGAQDKLDNEDTTKPSILGYVSRRFNDIQGFLNDLSIPFDDRLVGLIPQRAQELRDEGYATNGMELSEVVKKVGGENSIDTYEGEHNEVGLLILTDPNERVDREAIYAKYGGRLQLFVLTVAGLSNGNRALTVDEQEASVLMQGELVYNVATTAVLGAPDLYVIVR